MPEPRPLDIMSGIMALTSFHNAKNVIVMAAEMAGHFDEQAFRSALQETSAKFPELVSVLNEAPKGFRFYLSREHHPSVEIPLFIEEISPFFKPGSGFRSIMIHLTPRLDRTWNLWKEAPIETHVMRSSKNEFVLAFVIHHAVADATMALRIMTEITGRYDQIVTGQKPNCLSMPHVFSTFRKRNRANAGKFRWKDFLSQLWRDLAYHRQKPERPRGTGIKGDQREWHVNRVLSPEGTKVILDSFSKVEAHVIDNLVACTNMSLDKWNQIRHVPPGLVTSVVTINMRQRFEGEDKQNYSSMIFFRSNPTERENHAAFARLLARARRRQMRQRADLSALRTLSAVEHFFSVLPFAIRRRLACKFMEHQHYSCAVGFLGEIWPQFKGQAQGEESCLVRLGNADIIEVHGTGYKLAGNAAVNLYAYVYRRRFHLVLACSAAVLSERECEEFIELLVRTILEAAHLPQKSVETRTFVA
jgi:NRPS condensation-like uncharacterized protein